MPKFNFIYLKELAFFWFEGVLFVIGFDKEMTKNMLLTNMCYTIRSPIET